MYNNSSDQAVKLVTFLGTLIFIGVAVWWLESRFNALVPVIILGALTGVICVGIGMVMTHRTQAVTLENLAKMNQSDAMTDRYRQSTFREIARGESAQVRANATLRVLDAKRVDQIAQQRAGLLVDLERQQWEQRQRADAWGSEDDGDAALFNVME